MDHCDCHRTGSGRQSERVRTVSELAEAGAYNIILLLELGPGKTAEVAFV